MSEQNTQVLLKSYPVGWVTTDNFEIVSSDIPTPGDGEVLIRNIYLSSDPYMRGRMSDSKDRYTPGFQLNKPLTGYGVGEVVQSNADGFAKGDLVTTALCGWETYSVIPARNDMAKVDPSAAPLSYYIGALGMPGFTAYGGLFEVGQPKEGEVVFVSAASGAVGQMVGQLAKMKGCYVAGSAGTDAKVDYLLNELDFDAAFNYKTTAIAEGLKQTCPEGIDVYFDNVGGEMLDRVLVRMRMHGRIAACGSISQYNAANIDEVYGIKSLGAIVGNRITMRGFIVSDFHAQKPKFLEEVSGWLRDGKIKYREDIAHGLENAPSALIGMLKGENFGKQVIQVGDDPTK